MFNQWHHADLDMLIESRSCTSDDCAVPFSVSEVIQLMHQPWNGEDNHCPLAWLRNHHQWTSYWRDQNLDHITDVVHIGIGGSLIGMQMVDGFLKNKTVLKKNLHFIGGLEEKPIHHLLQGLNSEKTVVLFVSKSFESEEVIHHYDTIRSWQENINLIFAVTAHPYKATRYGINERCIVTIPSWVSGRFSVWSACSSSLLLAYGEKVFLDLIDGAQVVDRSLEKEGGGVPLLWAKQEMMNQEPLKARFFACYGSEFSHVPSYMQQVHMESLGKNIGIDGNSVRYSQVVFGALGTDFQHAVTQMLAQGSYPIAVDVIASRQKPQLLSHAIAQANTLHQGVHHPDPRKRINGRVPVNIILLGEPSALNAGALMAFYEYKIWFCAQWLGINAFDQWGVEHAKKQARELFQHQTNLHQENLLEWWNHLIKKEALSVGFKQLGQSD